MATKLKMLAEVLDGCGLLGAMSNDPLSCHAAACAMAFQGLVKWCGPANNIYDFGSGYDGITKDKSGNNRGKAHE